MPKVEDTVISSLCTSLGRSRARAKRPDSVEVGHARHFASCLLGREPSKAGRAGRAGRAQHFGWQLSLFLNGLQHRNELHTENFHIPVRSAPLR